MPSNRRSFSSFLTQSDNDLDSIEAAINNILIQPTNAPEVNSDIVSSNFLADVFDKEDGLTGSPTSNTGQNEIYSILNRIEVPIERIAKYDAYDEVYRSVPLVKRIVRVYKTYILQKNLVSGDFYILKESEKNKERSSEEGKRLEEAKEFINKLIESFDIETKLRHRILHAMLMYGDGFVEVLDLKKESDKLDLTKVSTVLNESKSVNNLLAEVQSLNGRNVSQTHLAMLIENVAEKVIKVEPDESDIQNAREEREARNSQEMSFNNSLLRIHNTRNIVILTTKYGTTLGYLEVDKRLNDMDSTNIAQSLSLITNKIANLSSQNSERSSDRETILNKIILTILKKVVNKNVTYEDSVIQTLKRFLIEQGLHRNQINLNRLNVRFIPVNRMVSFSIAAAESAPYGNSVVDALVFPSKLFILAQLSNIVMKLSRAPLTRKWIIDSSSTQMPNQLIQKLKRELSNNRIAVSDIASFKNVSKVFSDLLK